MSLKTCALHYFYLRPHTDSLVILSTRAIRCLSISFWVCDAGTGVRNDSGEQIAPALRDECAATPACAPFGKHFAHCTETVTEGKGFKHEDCVEELCECR